MNRLFVVEFTGYAIVAAEDEFEAEDVAERAMIADAGDIVSVAQVDTFDEGDPFPGNWEPRALPYGGEDDGDITIEGYFALARAAKAEAQALKLDPAAAVGDLFTGVPPLPKGE